MKKLLTTLFAVSLFLPAVAGDFPEGSPEFATSYDDALKKAEASGKPMLVVFSAGWCPPCQSMKNNVYTSEAIQAYHDDFVWAYLDVDEASNRETAQKFGVGGIPHIQFTDAKGKALDKQVGASSPDAFAKTLDGVLEKAKS